MLRLRPFSMLAALRGLYFVVACLTCVQLSSSFRSVSGGALRRQGLEELKRRNRLMAATSLRMDIPVGHRIMLPEIQDEASAKGEIYNEEDRKTESALPETETARPEVTQRERAEDEALMQKNTTITTASGSLDEVTLFFEEHESWTNEDVADPFFFDHPWGFCRDDRAHRQKLKAVKEFRRMDELVEALNHKEIANRRDGCAMESLFTEEKNIPDAVKNCVAEKGGMPHPSKLVNARGKRASGGAADFVLRDAASLGGEKSKRKEGVSTASATSSRSSTSSEVLPADLDEPHALRLPSASGGEGALEDTKQERGEIENPSTSASKTTAAETAEDGEDTKKKVLLIILDMLSFREVLRSLPKTMLYLSQYLNATIFDNFNVVGPNSPLNQYPMAHGEPFPARPGVNITGQKFWRDRDVWTDKEKHILSVAQQEGFRTFAGCDCSLHTRFQKCYCLSYWMHFAELQSQYAARTWSPVKGWCSTGRATQVLSPAFNATLQNGTAVRLRSFKRWGHGQRPDADKLGLKPGEKVQGAPEGRQFLSSSTELRIRRTDGAEIRTGTSSSAAIVENKGRGEDVDHGNDGTAATLAPSEIFEAESSSASVITSSGIQVQHLPATSKPANTIVNAWSDQEKEGEQLAKQLDAGVVPEGLECRTENGYSVCFDRVTGERLIHVAPMETGASYYFGGGQENVQESLGLKTLLKEKEIAETDSTVRPGTIIAGATTGGVVDPPDDDGKGTTAGSTSSSFGKNTKGVGKQGRRTGPSSTIQDPSIELESEHQVSKLLLEDLLDFYDVFKDEKAFAVAYFDEGHTMLHPKYRPGAPVVNNMDTFFRDFFRELFLRHPNLSLILCSDHGRIPPVSPFLELQAFHHRNPPLVVKLGKDQKIGASAPSTTPPAAGSTAPNGVEVVPQHLGAVLEQNLATYAAEKPLSPHHIYDVLYSVITSGKKSPGAAASATGAVETTITPKVEQRYQYLTADNQVPTEWSFESILHFEWPAKLQREFCTAIADKITQYRGGYHAYKRRQVQIGDMPRSVLRTLKPEDDVENVDEICDLPFHESPCRVVQSSSALIRPSETRDNNNRQKVLDSATVNVIVEFAQEHLVYSSMEGLEHDQSSKNPKPEQAVNGKFQYSAVILLDSGRVDVRHLAEITVYGHYTKCITKFMDEASMKRKGLSPQWCKCMRILFNQEPTVQPGFL
ncbi:unnamed protein product [Amoebophrya sp. A120]|nr:unnamed protein product [Amoebophrya sp. A120]|eukprot:GSA120T00018326001.1